MSGKILAKFKKKHAYILLVLLAFVLAIAVIGFFFSSKELKVKTQDVEVNVTNSVDLVKAKQMLDSVARGLDSTILKEENIKLKDSLMDLKHQIDKQRNEADLLILKMIGYKRKSKQEQQVILNEVSKFVAKTSSFQQNLEEKKSVPNDQVIPILVNDAPSAPDNSETKTKVIYKSDPQNVRELNAMNAELQRLQSRIKDLEDSKSEGELDNKELRDSVMRLIKKIEALTTKAKTLYVTNYEFKPIVGRLNKKGDAYRRKDLNSHGMKLIFSLSSASPETDFEGNTIFVKIEYSTKESGNQILEQDEKPYKIFLNTPYEIPVSKTNFGTGSFSFIIKFGSLTLCHDGFTVR